MSNYCSRRQFLKLGATASIIYLASDVIVPLSTLADSNSNTTDITEKYHLFLPYQVSRYGGTQELILKDGEICSLNIPPRTFENQELIFENSTNSETYSFAVVMHSLYELNYSLRGKILDTIDNAQFVLTESSRKKCKSTYDNLQDDYPINLEDLSLLDYIISTSKLNPEYIQRYQMGSDNYKISLIEQGLLEALDQLELDPQLRKNILGTYQYVKSLEPIPNFELLDILNDIITNEVQLPLEIRHFYSQASAISRAFTVDLLIADFINSESERQVYEQVKNGNKLSEEEIFTLESLTEKILNSSLPKNAQKIYLLAVKDSLGEDSPISLDEFQKLYDQYQNVFDVIDEGENRWKKGVSYGNSIVPLTNRALTTLGVEAGTGVMIRSLAGAAATNATLAWLGGGSVATGGLGMLGGLTIVSGGAALIGAAGIISFMAISEMDGEDLRNFTVAGLTGTIAGTGAVGLAWLTASSLGIAGSTTGAAAISSIIAALGGLTVMTGGASLVAFGSGYVVWSFLNGKKKRDNQILHYLETSTYALTSSTNNPIAQYIENNLKPDLYESDIKEIYVAPNIDLKKLNNALTTFAKQITFEPDEKIIALIDTSLWNDTKEGIILTDKRVISRTTWSSTNSVAYKSLTGYSAINSSEPLLEDADVNRFAHFLLNVRKENS